MVDLAQEIHDPPGAGLVVHLARRALLLDQSRLHDDDLVGHRHRCQLVMGDENGGDAQAGLQVANLEPHLLPQTCIKVGERLIQQQHVRIR